MEFTVYTFGDVEIFRAALAGVAMIFNADGFFVSDSGLGLGALTALGLLLGLVVILLNGIITQKIDLGGFIVMVLVFSILFVPKFSVNVEDYNGDAIAKVDHVPLGVALPAGLISGLAREMNIKMGTAFSTTEGYPTGLMTPEALRSPLKMLLSLRNGYSLMPERSPVLLSNLTNLVAYCVAGRDFNTPNAQAIKIKDAPITKLLDMAGTVNGLTLYADPATRESNLRPCRDVALDIDSAINSLYDSSDLTEIMTAAAARTGAAPIRVTAGHPEVMPVTGELMMDNLAMLFQVSGQSAENFIKTQLLMPYVARAHLCADSTSDPVMWAQCMPLQSSVIQWQEDEAAAGTIFQRIMFHGMNALFFLWICLSPVVAVLMLMMGVRGLKLAGSFLMFGAWTVSWYVGASVVNFYMLKQLQYELAMLGSFDSLTPTTIGWFFDTIQNKIAVAGTMMASVPLIMMTIMSGSMYGMVQLASRWGAKDYYDQGVNSPAALGGAPLMQTQSGTTMRYGGVTAFNENMGHGQNFTYTASAGMAYSYAKESATEATQKLTSGLSHSLDRALTDKMSYQQALAFADKLDATGNKEVGEAYRTALTAGQDNKTDYAQKKEAFERATWGGKGGANFAAGNSTPGAKGGFSAGMEGTWGQGVQEGSSRGTGQTVTEGSSAAAQLDEKSGFKRSHGLSLDDVKKLSHDAENIFKDSNQQQLSNEFGDARKLAEKATEALQVGAALGGQQSVSDIEMANKMATHSESARLAGEAHNGYFSSGDNSPAAQAYREAFNRSERVYAGVTDPVAKLHVRQMYALQAAALSEGGRPGSATETYLTTLGAASGMHADLRAPTTLAHDTNDSVRNEAKNRTASARAVTAPVGSAQGAAHLPTPDMLRAAATKTGLTPNGIPAGETQVKDSHDRSWDRTEKTGKGMAKSNENNAILTEKGQPAVPAAIKRVGDGIEALKERLKSKWPG